VLKNAHELLDEAAIAEKNSASLKFKV